MAAPSSASRHRTGRSLLDLAIAVGITIALNVAVFAPVIRDTPIRIPLGLAFVCFVPGYVFVAALYPERSRVEADRARKHSADSTRRLVPGTGLSGLERFVLGVGFSITIIPLIGYLFNFTPWGIRLTPILLSVSGFTILAAVVAAVRRRRLPEEERFRIGSPVRTSPTEWLVHDSGTEFAVNVVLIAALVLFVVSIGYGATTSSSGEQYSSLSLLTEADGALIDDEYPTEFTADEGREIAFGVDNHERRTVEYTVVVVEQRVEINGDETIVHDQQELDRFEARLEHDDTWHHEHELEPTMTDEQVRIAWLLYVGEVPSQPTVDNADYDAYLQITVNEAEA